MPVIKKYENRRLYDTDASRYVNLEDIARMVAEDVDIRVVDVKTGRDLTREILLQIVVEGGADLLPLSLLRRVIRANGADAQTRLRREQLALGLELLEAQLQQSEALFERLYDPHGDTLVVAEPPAAPYEAWGAATNAPRPAHDAHGAEELDQLRDQLARLEERLRR